MFLWSCLTRNLIPSQINSEMLLIAGLWNLMMPSRFLNLFGKPWCHVFHLSLSHRKWRLRSCEWRNRFSCWLSSRSHHTKMLPLSRYWKRHTKKQLLIRWSSPIIHLWTYCWDFLWLWHGESNPKWFIEDGTTDSKPLSQVAASAPAWKIFQLPASCLEYRRWFAAWSVVGNPFILFTDGYEQGFLRWKQ